MTVEEFRNVLLAEMEADSSTAFVDGLLKDARAALRAGKGTLSSLVSSGLNGKSFSRAVELTPAQVINACRQALHAYLSDGEGDDTVSATYGDFSTISR
jgi:hypothetical protein